MKNIIIAYEKNNQLKQLIVEEQLFEKELNKLMTDTKVSKICIDKREKI